MAHQVQDGVISVAAFLQSVFRIKYFRREDEDRFTPPISDI